MIIGVDASNLQRGGGVTHLIEFLSTINRTKNKLNKVYVFGGKEILSKFQESDYVIKVYKRILDKNFIIRFWWQLFSLSSLAKKYHCNLLFIPGGLGVCQFKPKVVMCRNMLPFEWKELKRYGFSLFTLKLLLLRFLQSISFRNANGVIFLTNYARENVQRVTGKLNNKTVIIPHGIDEKFFHMPVKSKNKSSFKIVYVSIIDLYKHQWHVVQAISTLIQEGYNITIDFIGPANKYALKKLKHEIVKCKIKKGVINILGNVAYTDLPKKYNEYDICVFASSCENMPNILLEGMASGLPIACSNMGPMPEILSNAGIYFNPEDPKSIAKSLMNLLNSPDLRNDLSEKSFRLAQNYSWDKCVKKTLNFFNTI